jgi:hypothetical protein
LVDNERHAGVDLFREGIHRFLQEQGETEPAMGAYLKMVVAGLGPQR